MTLLATLKRVNAPGRPEESLALRASVLVAILAAAAGVVREGVMPGAFGLAALLAIAVGSACSHLVRHRPGYLRKAVLALLAVAALARFLSEAASVGAGLAGLTELRLPLAELFLMVQVLHSFDLPSRRDLQFSLLSSLALVLVGGVLSTSPAFGTYLTVWAVASVVSLALGHRSQLEELPSLAPGGRAPAAPGGRRPVLRSVGGSSVVGLTTAAAVFLVMPPAGSPRLLGAPASLERALPVGVPGGLVNPGVGAVQAGADSRTLRAGFGYFGFSRTLDLAARGRPDNTPVMRVRAGRPDFWRAQTFDRWDGRRWTMSDERPLVVGGVGRFELPPPPEDKFVQYLGEPLVQTFYLQRPQPNLVYSAYKADQLYLPASSVFALSDGSVRTGFELDAGTVYTVVSRRPRVTEADLRRQGPTPPLPPEFTTRYTQLPEVPERVRELAVRLTVGAPTVYDKVRAIERWMGENLTYTLDVPPLPPAVDAVEQFLFVDRKGFCEQIGTTMVVLLRSLGIPARLAVGYTPGERDPFSGLYQVRARNAHGWAEVYFPGMGWQGFDPTAAVPLSGEASEPYAGLGALSFLSNRLPAVPGWVPEAGAAGAAVALAAGAAVEARAWRRRRRRPARSWAEACLDRLEKAGARWGRPRDPSQTAREYVADLASSPLGHPRLPAAARVLEAELFSGRPVPAQQRAAAEEIVAEALAKAGAEEG